MLALHGADGAPLSQKGEDLDGLIERQVHALKVLVLWPQ